MFLGIWLAERGWIPDFLLRIAVKFISKARIKKSNSFSEKLDVISSLRDGPIAESTPFVNKQHYEVPPAFFEKVLGWFSRLCEAESCFLFEDFYFCPNSKALVNSHPSQMSWFRRARSRSSHSVSSFKHRLR